MDRKNPRRYVNSEAINYIVLPGGLNLGAKLGDFAVVVIDPLGEKPVVMTGSHNLGFKASSANDDNLVIVEGNAPLAVAHAINTTSFRKSSKTSRRSYSLNFYIIDNSRCVSTDSRVMKLAVAAAYGDS